MKIFFRKLFKPEPLSREVARQQFRDKFIKTWIHRGQHTFVFCENCNNELCSSNSFISDTYDEKGHNHVLYKCSKCGTKVDYDFSSAPVPIKRELTEVQA